MTYSGKSPNYAGRIRRGSRKTVKKRSDAFAADKTAVRLVVCIWILFLAAVAKFLFPEQISGLCGAVLRTVGGSVDYKAAVSVLGEAVSGEKKFSEALSEAWSYAFLLSYDDVEVSSDLDEDITEGELYNNPPVPVSSDAGDYDDMPENTEIISTPAETDASPEQGAGIESFDSKNQEEIKVAAFVASQAAYSDIALPANVTYEMPEIIQGLKPVDGTVSSSFGYREHPADGAVRFHYGTDIAAEKGTEVVSFADGTVYATGDSSSYGLYLIIEHDDGIKTLYAHLDEITVADGSTVLAGECIGKTGDSGNATAPCLHFEIIVNGIYVNPEYYISWT